MAQAQLDAFEPCWDLASEVNVPLSKSAVSTTTNDQAVVYRYFRVKGSDLTVCYYDTDVLRPKPYIVHLPSFGFTKLVGWATGDARFYLKVGILDGGRRNSPKFEPLIDNEGGKLVCKVIPMRKTNDDRLVVGVDDEYIALAELQHKKWRVGDIWGANNPAYYWVQVVVAKDFEEAEEMHFYSKKVQFMIAFKHGRGPALPRTNRKRPIASKGTGTLSVAPNYRRTNQEEVSEFLKKARHSPSDPAPCQAQQPMTASLSSQ